MVLDGVLEQWHALFKELVWCVRTLLFFYMSHEIVFVTTLELLTI